MRIQVLCVFKYAYSSIIIIPVYRKQNIIPQKVHNGQSGVASRVHFRLAQFADRQHAAAQWHLQSEEHASHKQLLALKQASVEEMQRTIAHWKASGAPRTPALVLLCGDVTL